MSAMGRRKQTDDKEEEDSPLFNHLPVKPVSLGSLQATRGNVHSYGCNAGVDFEVSLLGH